MVIVLEVHEEDINGVWEWGLVDNDNPTEYLLKSCKTYKTKEEAFDIAQTVALTIQQQYGAVPIFLWTPTEKGVELTVH